MLFRVARLELSTMFSAPIAWIALIGLACYGLFNTISSITSGVSNQILTGNLHARAQTLSLLTGEVSGLFTNAQNALIVIIPLVCMGIFSREKASDTIKLLYSSPISMKHIVLGKFLATIVFSLVVCLMVSLSAFVIAISVKNADLGLIISGMLSLFLLCITYSAITLFFSSLSKYPVVDVVATAGLLAVLSLIGDFMKGVPSIEVLFYWLSIPKHVGNGFNGLLLSRDIGYFLLISALMVFLTYQKIMSEKLTIQQRRSGRLKVLLVTSLVLIMGVLISDPTKTLYWDTTDSQNNTISQQGQQILSQFESDVKITTYANLLSQDVYFAMPENQLADKRSFERYQRFLPNVEFSHQLYYYNSLPSFMTPPELVGKSEKHIVEYFLDLHQLNEEDVPPANSLKDQIDLAKYGHQSIRVIEYKGRTAIIPINFDTQPSTVGESHILTAFKSLLTEPYRLMAVQGHSERSLHNTWPNDWQRAFRNWTARESMVLSGVDAEAVYLTDLEPSNYPNLLLIAAPQTPYSESELSVLKNYLELGGDLLIATEPNLEDSANPLLELIGVRQEKGILATSSEMFDPTTIPAVNSGQLSDRPLPGLQLNTVAALTVMKDSNFRVTPIWTVSGNDIWLEQTGPNQYGQVQFTPEEGDLKGTHSAAIKLTRQINGKNQKIFVTGDADIFSNDKNRQLFGFMDTFTHWYTDGKLPLAVTQTPALDNRFALTMQQLLLLKLVFWGFIPTFMAALGWINWRRRLVA